MKSYPRSSALWSGLVVALVCLVSLVPGCFYADWSSDRSGGPGEPGTEYFVLVAPPLRFQASPLGMVPELRDYDGCPYCVPLDQYRMNPGDLKGWAKNFVTLKRVNGRCTEIGLWCGGVICRHYAFEYDAAGRLQARIDTEYELRREGESDTDWAERLKGQTPPVACVRELQYAWSEDGRTVEVTLRALQGKPQGIEPMTLPEIPKGQPGQHLETWRLNDQGLVTSVLRGEKEVYSAQYDDARRLLKYQRWGGEQVENRYDGQGRLAETHMRAGGGTRGIIVHAYPDGPRVKLPRPEKPEECHSYLVTHDKNGRVSRVRFRLGEDADILGNVFEEFRRDRNGCIIFRRVGIFLVAW